jgi:predicted nucleic-acid-binding protein
MLAIDTNVVVRYLTGDDPKQTTKARALIDGTDVFVATTVLLETEWVLRSVYAFDANDIAAALTAFGGLERVTFEDPGASANALNWAGQGIDFADALHLARSEGCEAFATFDAKFAKIGGRLSGMRLHIV